MLVDHSGSQSGSLSVQDDELKGTENREEVNLQFHVQLPQLASP